MMIKVNPVLTTAETHGSYGLVLETCRVNDSDLHQARRFEAWDFYALGGPIF